MSDNGATTTQGQSIPTALFEKMFGKDNGMPGRDELLSTMQDRSESSAKYKVGDEVLYAGERVKIIHVMITYHLADLSGEPIAMKVGEYLLDPAEEAGK